MRRGGGAWKVAYADFVTALMALFIVLWMMGSNQQVKQSVSGYFHDPRAYSKRMAVQTAGVNPPPGAADAWARLEEALRNMPEFQKFAGNVKFSVTPEGLRIDLLENEQGLFFVTGRAEPTAAGASLLAALAGEIGKMPNRVVVEGHTDALPFRNVVPSSGYGNWELSADRANAARRLLHQYGLRPEQVGEVRGFADQQLYNPANPGDAKNRRISVVVRF
jgi:chemotaxis protein MotB